VFSANDIIKTVMAETAAPSRGISREISVSRRISRQNTFRLLSVQVAEERSRGSDDDDDIDHHEDNEIEYLINGKIGGTLHFDGDLYAEPLAGNSDINEDVAAAAAFGGAAALSRGMTRSNSGRRTTLRRNSSLSSIGSFDGPIREIAFLPDEGEAAFLAEMGWRTRRCSDITTDSIFNSDAEPQDKQIEELSEGEPAECEKVALKLPSRRHDDSLEGLKGSVLSNCSTIIHGNLKRDKWNKCYDDADDDTSAAFPDSISFDSDNSNTLSFLASKLNAVSFDGESTNESLNSDIIRGGFNDSTSVARMKLSGKFKSTVLARDTRLDSIDFDGESENESLNSYRIRAGFHDSTSLAKAKNSRMGQSALSGRNSRFESINFDGESDSESLNSYRIRAGFHDSTSLAKAKFSRKCSSGIYDSTNTATTTNSTVLSDFLAIGDVSFSSMESSSFDAFSAGRTIEEFSNNTNSKSELALRFCDYDDATLNDIASQDSDSFDVVDFHSQKR